MCLKKNCRGNTAHNLHREISRYGVSNYLEKVFGDYHRILDYDQCESDIKISKKLVIARLRKEFGDRPEEYTVQASCLKVA